MCENFQPGKLRTEAINPRSPVHMQVNRPYPVQVTRSSLQNSPRQRVQKEPSDRLPINLTLRIKAQEKQMSHWNTFHNIYKGIWLLNYSLQTSQTQGGVWQPESRGESIKWSIEEDNEFGKLKWKNVEVVPPRFHLGYLADFRKFYFRP